MSHRRVLAPIALAALLSTQQAEAFAVDTAASDGCHEMMTARGVLQLLAEYDLVGIELPDSNVWKEITEYFASKAKAELGSGAFPQLSDAEQFFLFSILVGVRSPDTDGHSTTDLNALRQIHADPDPEGQYRHALRGRYDDYLDGDLNAVAGTRQQIQALFEESLAVKQSDSAIHLTQVSLYLEFYGAITVDVLEVAYLLGQSIHIIQDSYSHMLRNEDASVVLHVTNYIDAIYGDFDESRDGLAHSKALDECTEANVVLSDAAIRATVGLSAALRAYLQNDASLLERGFSACADAGSSANDCGWLTYNPLCEVALTADDSAAIAQTCCTKDNDYCESPWLTLARSNQTEPLLAEYLGCSVNVSGKGRRSRSLLWPILAGVLAAFARRRARPHKCCLLLPTALMAPQAQAAFPIPQQAFVGVEGHLSLLNDRPNASTLSPSVGYAVTGGFRWSHLGVRWQVERDYWGTTELFGGFAKGVLNLGLGGEYLYANGTLRTSLLAGPSVLLFDTPLHSAGQVGYYVEARPLDWRFRLGDAFALWLSPLTAAYAQPVLDSGPVIRVLEYRTALCFEYAPSLR